MFYHFVMAIHILACFFLVVAILLQTGRGAGLSVFGGGGDSLITTPTGSNFLKTMTQVMAGVFAMTSLFLTLLTSRTGISSVTSGLAPMVPPPVSAPAQAPATPAATTAQPPLSVPAQSPAKH